LRKETDSVNPREGIVKALREHPEGLTIKDIAELTGSHRHTITKYVYELIGARVILERDIGAAKLCYLMETYMGREAQAVGVMKGSLGFRQSWKGQAQLLTLLVALLLVPAGFIAAQTFGNTTATDGMAVAVDGVQAGIAADAIQQATDIEAPADASLPDASVASEGSGAEIQAAAANETPSEEETAAEIPQANETVPQEETITGTANETIEEPANETIGETAIVPEGNETLSETNETMPAENETLPETNETMPEENATITGIPAIEITIENPARITRSEDFTARVVVRNVGDGPAQNAVLEWILPAGFEAVSGNVVETIGTIAAGEERAYEILVHSTVAAARGDSQIRARVTYE
jgi:hypothetical protein